MQKITRFMVWSITAFMLAAALYGCTPHKASTAPPAQHSASIESMTPQAPASPSSATEETKKKYQFAIVYGGPHPFFAPWEAAAQQAAIDFHLPLPNVTCPQNWDQLEQNSIIDGLTDQGLNGLGIFTADAVVGNEKISELATMDIPAVALDGPPAQPSEAKFCYATDENIILMQATQALVDRMKSTGKKKGNIVLLCSGLADTSTNKKSIIYYIKEVLEKPENSGFVLYKVLPDTDAEKPAEEAITAMYSSYIDQVDGIICSGYINTQVLARTLNNRKSDDGVVIIGRDDAPETLEAIRNGSMFGTMAQSSWAMGYVGIAALKLFADGYTWKKDAPFLIDSGSFLLKKDGLGTYTEKQKQIAYDFAATIKEKYFDPPTAQ